MAMGIEPIFDLPMIATRCSW